MATLVSHTAVGAKEELTPDVALRYAWMWWLGFLAVPFVLFLYVVWSLMDDSGASRRDIPAANVWFIVSMAYIILAVPAAIFWRSRVFKAYWSGECVSPRSYLTGMLTVWATLEIGGIFSLIGCLISDSLLPNLLPSLVAFMLFTPLWPSGRAMVCSAGSSDDPEQYEEPR